MNVLSRIFSQTLSDAGERTIFFVALAAAALLIASEFPVVKWIPFPQSLKYILSHNALHSIVSSVSASIVAAYIFYIFIELLPRIKQRKETLGYLNNLLFVIFDAFNDRSLGGPKLPLSLMITITERNTSGLTFEFIETLSSKLNELTGENYTGSGLNPYTQVAEAISARLPIVELATSMANGLSFSHGVLWSDIVCNLRQIGLEDVETPIPMSNDTRRKILLTATLPFLEKWLKAC